jgi:protein arginine kinase activator
MTKESYMEYCPFSGSPCPHDKVYAVTDIKDNKSICTHHMCHEGCGGHYIESLFRPATDKIEVKGMEIPIQKNQPIKSAPPVITNLQDLIEVLLGANLPVHPIAEKDACPKCGLTLKEFNYEGKFGCEHCYTHYMDEFLALAGPFQDGEDTHRGKVPTHYKMGVTTEEKINYLKLNLARAIETEKYEDAAKYKEKLKELGAD